MKTRLLDNFIPAAGLRVLLVLAVFTVPLAAQAQNILTAPQTGTLQLMRQDDGFIVVSGRRYDFDNEVTEIYFNNEPVGPEILDEGLVIRFTINGAGLLMRIEVLGVVDKTEILEQN